MAMPTERPDSDDARQTGSRERPRRSCAASGGVGAAADGGAAHAAGAVGRGASRPPVAIRRPTSFLSAVRPSQHGHDPAAVHDRDPVGQLEDLVELGRDEQDRRPGVALGDGLAVDELDAADVEAARRLVEDEQLAGRGRTRGPRRPSAGCRPTACRPSTSRTASGCRSARLRSSAVVVDGAVVAQDARARTAAGGSWSGRGCRRGGTTGSGRSDAGRPGRRRRPPR